MKKLFYIVLGLMFFSCNPPKNVIKDYGNGNTMLSTYDKKYSMKQFDSLCIADTLPQDFSKWSFLGLKDYETGEKTSLYLYMKSNSTIYKAEDTKDDSIKVNKRIITD